METEKERKALLAKLNLLADMMKRHEWTVFEQKEAEDEEEASVEEVIKSYQELRKAEEETK